MVLAKRPLYSIEQPEGHFSHICGTCWEAVHQPFIRGIFYHSDDWQQQWFQCKKLVPLEYDELDRDSASKCMHEYKFYEGLNGAVKCIKCGKPQRIDIFDHDDWRGNYFCFECNKPFSILAQHFTKKHKKKGFEYKQMPNK